MAKVSEQDRKIFTDLYQFYSKWHDAPLTADTFPVLADDVAALIELNGQKQLAIELFLGVYEYFGKKYKQVVRSDA